VLLWILSDLHLESTRGWDLPPVDARPNYDVMVVAGDLIPRMERGVRWLAQRAIDKPVVYVHGNHEAFGADIDRTVDKAREAARGTSIRVLQDDACVIDGVTFVGATFWTDFKLFGDVAAAMAHAGSTMNDYRKIRRADHAYRLRPRDTLLRHVHSRAFFSAAISEATTGKIVAVTHHAPAPETAKAGTERDLITAAYVNGDRPSMLREVDVWVYGHTHETRSIDLDGTRVVTNAKGYGPWGPSDHDWENPNFDPNFTVEI
jgi:predicted phosphodiesterase